MYFLSTQNIFIFKNVINLQVFFFVFFFKNFKLKCENQKLKPKNWFYQMVFQLRIADM